MIRIINEFVDADGVDIRRPGLVINDVMGQGFSRHVTAPTPRVVC